MTTVDSDDIVGRGIGGLIFLRDGRVIAPSPAPTDKRGVTDEWFVAWPYREGGNGNDHGVGLLRSTREDGSVRIELTIGYDGMYAEWRHELTTEQLGELYQFIKDAFSVQPG